jgi:hypothetical protein
MGFDIYKDKLIVYNHMIDLFDYILTLFDASYNADTLKRSFKIMLFYAWFERIR